MKIVLQAIAILLICGVSISCTSNLKEQDIVIVDIANFGRAKIAEQISVIDSLNPKVIGLDIQFKAKRDPVIDSILRSALDRCDNLVLINELTEYKNGENFVYESQTGSAPYFLRNATEGFANVIYEEDEVNTIKRFAVYEEINNKRGYNFSVMAAMLFDSASTKAFIRDNSKVVEVDFLGNYEKFNILSARDVLDGKINSQDIEGKIVLFGSLRIEDLDMFHTPLNKTNKIEEPDMFGVVYIANVISQIIHYNQTIPRL